MKKRDEGEKATVKPGNKKSKGKATVKPGVDGALAKPGGSKATVKPGEGMATVKPGDEKATVKPGEVKATVKPIGIKTTPIPLRMTESTNAKQVKVEVVNRIKPQVNLGPRPDVFQLDEDLIPAGPYYHVRAGRAAMSEEVIVFGEPRWPRRKEAGFDLAGDDRIRQAIMRHRMDVGQNISLSFNPANMICDGCKVRGQHSVIGGEDGQPVVLIAGDQNFPPVLYSKDENPCVGIMRLEDGSIKEIGFLVGDLLDGIMLPAGSVVMIGSVSDLGKQGMAGYAEELARSMRILRERQGQRIQVVALPPILLGGINRFELLRNIVEIEFWAEKMEGGDGALLRRSRAEVVKKIGEQGIGSVEDLREQTYALPKGVGLSLIHI